MSVAVRGEAGRPPVERPAYRSPVTHADTPPLGELLGDVAAHAQGIVRAEVRLAIEQARAQVDSGVRTVALFGGAAVIGVLGIALLMVAATLALATVVAVWLAALIVAVAALAIALALAVTARSTSADTGSTANERGTP